MTNSELVSQLLQEFRGNDNYGEFRVFKDDADALLEYIEAKDVEIARLKDELAEKVAETYAIAELMQFGAVTAYAVMQRNQTTGQNEEVEVTYRRDRAKYLVEQSTFGRWIMPRHLTREGFSPPHPK